MTDPSPDTPSDAAPPERERIEPAPTRRRLDLLPLVYVLGFFVLAGAIAYLWRNPAATPPTEQEVARLNTVDQQLQALAGRVQRIESRPAPAAPPAPPDLSPLEARIAALENRPAPSTPEPGTQADLTGVATRLDEIASRQDALASRLTAELGGLGGRIDALEPRLATAERQAGQVGGLADRAGALETRLADAERQAGQVGGLVERASGLETRLAAAERQAGQVAGLVDRAGRLARLQSAIAALDAGQKLGPLPDAPPALARFADAAPPTEAALRLSFPVAADAAHRASQPAITEDQPLLNRMWTRAQQVVTVRQGERVLLGDPIAGVLALARQRLDAGDLAGTVAALDGLAGPARAAMADWIGQARALLDARAALAQMTAQG